jgi:L-alanine-DL-glutamate epimerase-like enolase superfamily enzyme
VSRSTRRSERLPGGSSTSDRPAIVTVQAGERLIGVGEGYGPDPHIVETIVEQKSQPRLLAEDPLDYERLWSDMLILDTYWNQKGQGIAAASGVDMALWRYHRDKKDLRGRGGVQRHDDAAQLHNWHRVGRDPPPPCEHARL